ncbi:ABC transporter permease [Thalassoglobus polymorphus]|uniref:ABC-2 family transporter protein n=1 Tax=Thalassoglobus polymorphus TaxID=2527994 RepID=A0A517QHW9_9PLAN|nr:ABC transporter permease subunit [Thalassoglobus polymorphus]QDT31218.1 ABC-2 family transporter protein [Thalassoglobus polymorphus]
MNKFLALVRRALQTDSRLLRGYLARLLLAGFILLTLITFQRDWASRGAPGLDLFRSVSLYNYFFITILGTAFFATAITEEKEERTLSLLKMAGVGATSLILGKWTPRMIGAFLLLCVQIPFTVLAVTLGGVQIDQVVAVYISLFAHLFLVGSIGLFCSVVMSTTTGACGLAGGVLILHHFLPTVLALALRNQQGFFIVDVIISISMMLSDMNGFRVVLGLMMGTTSSIWISTQVLGNLIVGGLFMAVTWVIFDRCTCNEKEPGSLNFFDRLRKRSQNLGRGRVWDAAIVWKDHQLLSGGAIFLLLKTSLYLVFMIGSAVLTYGGWSSLTVTIGYSLLTWSFFLMFLELGIMATRLYRQELSNQTWSILLLIPRRESEIIYSKFIGGLTSLLPLTFCFFLGSILLGEKFLKLMGDILGDLDLLLVMTYFTLQALIAIHCSVYLAVTQKWAIWPIALFSSGFVVFMGNVMGVSCLAIGGGPGEVGALAFIGSFFSAIILIPLHLQIGKRLVELAGE